MSFIGAMAENKNIGAALTLHIGGNAVRTSAAETQIVGQSFDRAPPGGGDQNPITEDSGVVVVVIEGNLDAAATVSLALQIQDAAPTAPGGNTPGTFANVDAKHQPTGPVVINGGAGGPFRAVLRMDLRLTSLRRFIRANITPDFSAAGGASATNTAFIASVWVCGSRNVKMHSKSGDWTVGYEA